MQKLLFKRTTLLYRCFMFLVSAFTSTQYTKYRMLSESALCK